MSQWFENENFWINFAPIMFDDAHWQEAPAVAQYVKKIANLKKGSSVLDAGCGLGRISVELAALDLEVTGVDIIKSELDAARESAKAEGVQIDFINADLRAFVSPKKFDCAVNLYTSFGYCDTEMEDMQIIKNIASSLKEGGTFILECVSRETAALYFTPGEIFERAGYKVATHFSAINSWQGLRSQWTLYPLETSEKQIKEGSAVPVYDHVFVQRLYSAPELCKKIEECGFSQADAYGDFTLTPYNENARIMVIVAKK